MASPFEYLAENEPSFRKARLPALYADFHAQRTLNPDGYQANVSAWRRALALLVRSGLLPSARPGPPNVLILDCDEQLLRALESKQYGRPLSLGAVVHEALKDKDLLPLAEFLAAKDSVFQKQPWSLWTVAGWALRQAGLADLLPSYKLPNGQFVVVSAVEEAARDFVEKNKADSPFARTFSKPHFHRTFAARILDGKSLSEADMDVLLTFLSRDKNLLLYDGKTIKIKAPGAATDPARLTEDDASVGQLKELLAYLTHQTALLAARVDDLAAAARAAVARQNRLAALAALKAKKAAEATLAQRFASVGQLEAVAARLEQAADNVQMVAVMEASGRALASLNRQAGGAARVEDVVDRLREQMDAADEVASILAEGTAAGAAAVDEADVDEELAAMEREQEAERKKEVEEPRRAEQTRPRLEEEAGKAPQKEEDKENERPPDGHREQDAVDRVSAGMVLSSA
ncbi:hypothetical protein P8C59_005064 [Phyllachora maydis]|uniref:Charged multivesicular body protein 7 n=1 Tax=Phyllachora maydis TaxID=1825666 RepID=A0AAD9I3K0_9PEZI|nr:hypothetical protein P8C59_005064 [Phyllachora maydis]